MSNSLIQSEARRPFRIVAKGLSPVLNTYISEKSKGQFYEVPYGFEACKVASCHIMYLVFSISSEFWQFMHLSQSFK